jgi:pimeloyl-ACP methyl ester carboxylesterase
MKKRKLAITLAGAAGAAIAVKFLRRADSVIWDKVAPLVPHSERSRFIRIDGTSVHYQEFGDTAAPPLILIHGYTASLYVWKTAAPLLAKAGFRVIALDLIGFGFSEKPRWFAYSIESQARIIERFMDTLGIGRAHIVGSSYGGAVALSLTLDYAARVETLILADSVCNDKPKNHPILRLAALPLIGELITPFFADSKLFLRKRMHNTLAPANHHLITADRVESVRRPLFAADAHHSVLATSRNWHAKRIEQDAHMIDKPTLIIWGEEDRVIPIECGHKLHNEINGSRLVMIRNCGHVPQEESPKVFTHLVSSFINTEPYTA